MAISSVSTSAAALLSNKSGTPSLTPLTFDSLGAMETHLFGVEKKAVAKYRSEFEKEDNKAISVDEMKEMLKKRFPGYTLTDTEPTDPVKGKHLLYIDDTNMNKLANDADYRAKVMGLMEREYAGNAPMTFNLGNTTFHSITTGSVFSLSESNPSEDGIPYAGMGMGEGFSETTGPSDGPLPPDFLSKTKADKAKGKASPSKPGSVAWLKEMIEKRRAEIKEAEKLAAAEAAQKKASEERVANNGIDIIV